MKRMRRVDANFEQPRSALRVRICFFGAFCTFVAVAVFWILSERRSVRIRWEFNRNSRSDIATAWKVENTSIDAGFSRGIFVVELEDDGQEVLAGLAMTILGGAPAGHHFSFNSDATWDLLQNTGGIYDFSYTHDYRTGTQPIESLKDHGFRMIRKRTATVTLPMWFPFSLASLALLYCGRRMRFGKDPGKCRKCGYDVRESPVQCPECGTAREKFAKPKPKLRYSLSPTEPDKSTG